MIDGCDVLDLAYDKLTENGEAPADCFDEYDLSGAIDDAVFSTTDNNRALFEILLTGYADDENAWVWDEIQRAAANALRAYAQERWEEAKRECEADEDWDE